MTETKKRIRQKKQSEAEREITPQKIANVVMELVAIVDDFRDRLDKSKLYHRCEKIIDELVAAKDKRITQLQEQVKRMQQHSEWAERKRKAEEKAKKESEVANAGNV